MKEKSNPVHKTQKENKYQLKAFDWGAKTLSKVLQKKYPRTLVKVLSWFIRIAYLIGKIRDYFASTSITESILDIIDIFK